MDTTVTEAATQMQACMPTDLQLCAHCATPVRNRGDQFCCKGCEFVYRTIHSLGLSDFYRFREKGQEARADQIVPTKIYSYLDEPQVKEKLVELLSDGHQRVRFYLPTIHCAACVWLLEKLTEVVAGIKESRVSFGSGQIELVYDPTRLSLSEVAGILNSIGYAPVPATEDIVSEQNTKEDREMLRRIGVAAVCAANTMMLATSLFQSYFTGMEEPYLSLFKWVSALIALPAVAYAAVPFYRSAIGSVFVGALHIDLPISVAIVAAYIAGVFNTATGGQYVYFDSVTALIFLLLLARYVQRRAIHRARASTMTSWDLFPATVRVVEQGRILEKPYRELKCGDVVEVLPGERVPADGQVVFGQTSLNSAFLTGESLPTEVCVGGQVLSGSINIESVIRVHVLELGQKTRLGKIISALERGQSEKTPLENQANRLSGYFICGVLFLAALTYSAWWYIDSSRAFDATIALLIVTCPCALGLAIPSAMTVALARAQKADIFIKRPEALHMLAKAKHIYFDKTGTLTEGRLNVCQFSGDPNFLSIAKALAYAASLHPVSAAIVDYCGDVDSVELIETKHVPARGVEGALKSGSHLSLGSYKWLLDRAIELPGEMQTVINSWLVRGHSVSILEVEGVAKLAFGLEDTVPEAVKPIISRLQSLGKEIYILSGDSQSVVSRVAQTLNIPSSNAFGDLYPEEKARIIEDDSEITVMVGDGLNDGQAMRVSDVGIGLCGGIEATLESADIFIGQRGLTYFEVAYFGAMRTQKIIVRNLSFSVMYNVLGASAAALGYVTPLFAAILMPISSLSVILSSISERSFESGDKV